MSLLVPRSNTATAFASGFGNEQSGAVAAEREGVRCASFRDTVGC